MYNTNRVRASLIKSCVLQFLLCTVVSAETAAGAPHGLVASRNGRLVNQSIPFVRNERFRQAVFDGNARSRLYIIRFLFFFFLIIRIIFFFFCYYRHFKGRTTAFSSNYSYRWRPNNCRRAPPQMRDAKARVQAG